MVIVAMGWSSPVRAQKFPIPDFQVKIPGLTNFQAPMLGTCGTNQACYIIPWIGDYLTAVIRFAVIAGTFIAFVMMVWGAFLYLVSGGFASQSEEATSMMSRAVFGLVLLFTAYILLRTIDPSLVNFKPIMIPAFKNLGEINLPVVPERGTGGSDGEGRDRSVNNAGGGPPGILGGTAAGGPITGQCAKDWNFVGGGAENQTMQRQCNGVSAELKNIIDCMNGKIGSQNVRIFSLLQNYSNPEACAQWCNAQAAANGLCSGGHRCQPNTSRGAPSGLVCPHRCGSDHYAIGGPRAADLDIADGNNADCVMVTRAALQCGGHGCYEGNHVHVYVGPRGCVSPDTCPGGHVSF